MLSENSPLSPNYKYKSAFTHAKLNTQSFIDDCKLTGDTCIKIIQARNALHDISNMLGPEAQLCKGLISKFEDVLALIAGIMSSTTPLNTLSIVLLYIKTIFKESLFQKVWDLFSKIFDKAYQAVRNFGTSGKLDTQSDSYITISEIISHLKDLITNWRRHREGPLAKNLANVLTALVTFGFVGEREEPISIGTYELFTCKAWDMQKGCNSFIDMVIDTCMFFLERGYSAFVQRDLSLLLYDDRDSAEMDIEYSKLISAEPVITAGKLSELSEDFIDDLDYIERLNKLIVRITSRIKMDTNKSSPMKTILCNRLIVLKKLEVSFLLAQKKSPLRIKPYGLAIVGGSAVGKSTINSVILKALLHHNGFPSKKENVVTINDADKFLSEYKPWHSAVTIDDYGNLKAEHYDAPPTTRIIDFLNNIQKASLQADIDMKGVLMLMMKMFTVTSNVKHLLANTFSNEPVSIMRRFNYFLDCRLKPEFVDPLTGGLDGSKVTGFIPDCWYINLERVMILRSTAPDKQDTYKYDTVLKDASLRQVIDYLKKDSTEHFQIQKNLVTKIESCYDIDLCEHSDIPSECPLCKKLDTQGFVITDLISDVVDGLKHRSPDEYDDVFDAAAELMRVKNNLNTNGVNLRYREHNILSPSGEKTPTFRSVFQESQKLFWQDIPGYTKCTLTNLTDVVKEHKEKIIKASCAALGIGVSIYAVVKLVKYFRLLTSQSEEKAPEILPTDKPNPWKKVKPIKLPYSITGKTCTREQVIEKIKKSIGYATITDPMTNKFARCCIFPICHNYWLLPAHMLIADEVMIQVRTTRPDELGLNFSEIISPEKYVTFNADFVLVCLVNGGPVPNLHKWLMTDDEIKTNGSSVYGTLIHKNDEGIVTNYDVKVNSFDKFTSTHAEFEGFDYHLPCDSFPGLCMAPFIPKLNVGRILGFHLAGRNGTPYGVSGIIRYSDVESAIRKLSQVCPLQCHSEGNFLTEKYGINYEPKQEVSTKHPVKWLTDDDEGQEPTIEVLGSHSQPTARFRSSVRKSIISDTVTEVMGIERLHGPPSSRNINKHWHRDLSLMSHPKGLFIPRIMDKAREDLKTKVRALLKNDPQQLALVHPYPKDTVLSGADGITSVDRVELNSSMGFPINKKKNLFLQPVERQVEGITEVIDFEDPQYWAEVERMEDVLSLGERIYTIFRGNLKDEAVKFTKDKIRVFAGCEFAFTCLVRKFYLPIVRLIQTNWLHFECAVGINAHGPEWDALANHLHSFYPNRMVAGDYKAFDKAVAPEITMSAFSVLIDIARQAGYTAKQLRVMQGIATEICYPTYEMDGVFVSIFGSNPSGHPLTVILNNLVNSLYMRYAYYFLHDGEEVPPFDERVKLVCYGDDNTMSVHEDEKLFNHTSIAKVLEGVGVTYTMADKKSESIPFIPISQVSFLKREFRYDENVGRYVAPLEIDSIAKSLHNYMFNRGSEVTKEEIAGAAVRNALNEFFYHGKQEYTVRAKQLQEITDKHDLHLFVGEIPSYEMKLEEVEGRKFKFFDKFADVPLS